MRPYLPFLLPLLLAGTLTGAAEPSADLQGAIDAALYRIEPDGDAFRAANHRQQLQVRFSGDD